MIAALALDLELAGDFPPFKPLLGRALATYPLEAARSCRAIARLYLATHRPEVKSVSLRFDPIILDPPAQGGAVGPGLAAAAAAIRSEIGTEDGGLELLAVLFTHAPCLTGEIIEQAVSALRASPEADAALTVARYDHFHPREARTVGPDGRLAPVAAGLDGGGEAWYPDWALALLRPRVLDALAADPARASWRGTAAVAVRSEGATPVESAWQAAQAEWWLEEHGWRDATPVLEPKPQPKAARPEPR